MNNYTVISFPGLGIEWNPGKELNLGPLALHYYGILIAVGLMLAVVYAWKRSKEFGIKSDDLADGVLWVVPFAVLCARLYYCAFKWSDYASDPLSILYIWKGGLAIYGGVIGAVIGVVVFAKVKKIKVAALLDVVAIGFLIGQCIGRWGNFFNREAFGAETDWFLRMGLLNTYTGEVEYHHPTFLYESVWNLIGFVILHFASKKRKYDGQIALGYVAWYGFGRTVIEALRTDSLYWGDFRVSQLLAAVSCLVAAAILLFMTVKEHDTEKLFVNQVADIEESFVDEEDDEEIEDEADGEEEAEEEAEEEET